MGFTPQGTDTCLRVRPTPVGHPRGCHPRALLMLAMVLCLLGDCFASRLKLVLVKIQPSLILVKSIGTSSKTEILCVFSRSTLKTDP